MKILLYEVELVCVARIKRCNKYIFTTEFVTHFKRIIPVLIELIICIHNSITSSDTILPAFLPGKYFCVQIQLRKQRLCSRLCEMAVPSFITLFTEQWKIVLNFL